MNLFSASTYANRRALLQNMLPNKMLLFLGNQEESLNYPSNTYHFRQDSSFLYFFGLDLPSLAATIDTGTGEIIMWGDDLGMDDIIWMGPQSSLQTLALNVGLKESRPLNKLASYLKKRNDAKSIQFLPPYRASTKIWLHELTGLAIGQLIESSSSELIKACVSIRSIKEDQEIEHLETQMKVAYLMHTSAMRNAYSGASEQTIAGILEGISFTGGGMTSFPTILSKNGQTLHNHLHNNILKDGDLLLVDAGCTSPMGYATDHTRTTPVGGHFSQKQKEIYQIVLNANNAAREASAPGVFYKDVHLVACRTIALGLSDLGLITGDIDEAIEAGAHALFMPHGLGHMLGLDVHDMEGYGEDYVGYDEEIQRSSQFGLAYLRLGRRLQEGFVITNEPGIYFIPELIALWEKDKINKHFINFEKVKEYLNFGGIRLEDDLLIEKEGARILGQRIPITIEEVEKEVQLGAV